MRLLAATMACGRLGLRGLLRVCLHCCSLFVKTCPLFSFVVGNLLDFWETSVSVTCVSRLVSITGSLEWKFFWKCAFRCVRIGELEAAWLHQGGRGGRYCRLRISCGRLCVPTLQVLASSSRRHFYNVVKIGPASHPQPFLGGCDVIASYAKVGRHGLVIGSQEKFTIEGCFKTFLEGILLTRFSLVAFFLSFLRSIIIRLSMGHLLVLVWEVVQVSLFFARICLVKLDSCDRFWLPPLVADLVTDSCDRFENRIWSPIWWPTLVRFGYRSWLPIWWPTLVTLNN